MKLSFAEIWNSSLNTEDRPLKERPYCWASELGKPMVDRYLAMTATPYSNSPNTRSRRKFFAGNVWEFVAGLILSQLGIIQDNQQEVWTHGALSVKGKLDYLLGGKPNYDKARDTIRHFQFQKEMTDRFVKVIEMFEQTIGYEEIEPRVHEIKSCSEYVIDKLQNGGNIIGHDLQIHHYLKGLNMPQGEIDYISKNDALMETSIINFPNLELDNKCEQDLITLKGYLVAKQQPPKEPLILFEEKFTKNFGIEYSSYLTLVYGFKEPMEYSELVKGKIGRWNRVLARLKQINEGVRGKATKKEPSGKLIVLTDNNKKAIEEMGNEGFNAYELSRVAKVAEEEIEEIET